MKLKDSKALAVVTSSALVLFAGLLVVQHLRHGWPFSLHHGMGQPAPSAHFPPPNAGSVAPTHPRAEVEIARSPMHALLRAARKDAYCTHHARALRCEGRVIPPRRSALDAHTESASREAVSHGASTFRPASVIR